MRLFRYLDAAAGLATLREGAFKVTRPNQFNDPFEYLLRVRTSRRVFRKEFLQHPGINNVIRIRVKERLEKAGHTKPTSAEVRNMRLKVIEELRNEFYTTFDKGSEQSIRDRLETLSKTMGVACFSTENNHPLMWSHYADGHKGMVIEIDTEIAFPEPPTIIEIKYVDEPPEYDFLDGDLPNNPSTQKHFQDTVLGRKSTIWEYEKEQRIQFDIGILKQATNPQNQELLLFEIPKHGIKQVILGCRFPESEIASFEEIISHPDYKTTEIQIASPSTRDYKLIYNTLSKELTRS